MLSKRRSANAAKSIITIDEEQDLDEVTILHDSRHNDTMIIESGSDEKEEDAECTEDQSTHTFLTKKTIRKHFYFRKINKMV